MTTLPTAKQLSTWLAGHSQELAGAAIAVVDRYGAVEVATIGRPDIEATEAVTSETLFMLGSTSKLITATLVCQQVEEGKIELDDLVTQHLPELSGVWEDSKEQTPTIRQLLSHSGGVIDLFEPISSVDDLVAKLIHHGCLAKPGELVSYSNIGYVILGFVLEKITGLTWSSLARRQIFDVLDLPLVQLGVDDEQPGQLPVAEDHVLGPDGSLKIQTMWPRLPGIFAAAGTTTSANIRDAAVLLGALLWGKVTPDSAQLLSPSSLQLMQTLQQRLPGPSVFCEGWGLGWSVINKAHNLVGHMGGTSTFMLGSTELGKAVFFLSNTGDGAVIGRKLAFRALGMDLEPAITTTPTPMPDSGVLARFRGRYASPLFSWDVEFDNGDSQDTVDGNRPKLFASYRMGPEGDAIQIDLEHWSDFTFLGKMSALTSEFTFISSDESNASEGAEFLHVALRALRRVSKH